MFSPSIDDLASDGLQVRAASGFKVADDGEFIGRAVPYNKRAELMPGLTEVFLPGAFAAQVKDPGRVKIAHAHNEVIGRAVELDDRPDGLWVRGKISQHVDLPDARKALAQLRDGLIDELSVGFFPVKNGMAIREDKDGGILWEHSRASLREISVVPWGNYKRDARVMSVRAQDHDAVRLLVEQIAALRVV